MDDSARQHYSAEYAARHGDFALIPAAYAFLLDGDRVLLQLRSGTGYYDGWWGASAAGHVERGESAVDAARREAAEEIGVAIDADALVPLTTVHRTGSGGPADERVDFFFACRRWNVVPVLLEPETAADLRWFPLDALPERVVHHERFVLEAVAAGAAPPIAAFGFAAPDATAEAAESGPVPPATTADGDDDLVYGGADTSDLDDLIAFWLTAAENGSRPVDTPAAVGRLIGRDPDAVIVARRGGRIVGTIIAGFDGWRAHLYRLAVDPAERRRGVGRELLRRAEERLVALGVTRIDAMVLDDNDLGRRLWTALGYTEQLDWRRWVRTP
ncbi:GNAT family N-acetyltransferase [Agromyces seonyuensis]|uniref:GNAT family N-acetyltransferase n=1 Tax=Agromyces seonyuensis TaxID=2662446 RepID=A0A6I4NW13_9MICO|nr:GNAT family N-acetyltransferase [Agromyces seonyuensis]